MITDEKLRQLLETSRELSQRLADLERQIQTTLEVPGECVPPTQDPPPPPEPPTRERPLH